MPGDPGSESPLKPTGQPLNVGFGHRSDEVKGPVGSPRDRLDHVVEPPRLPKVADIDGSQGRLGGAHPAGIIEESGTLGTTRRWRAADGGTWSSATTVRFCTRGHGGGQSHAQLGSAGLPPVGPAPVQQ